jgi:hypothetical protein
MKTMNQTFNIFESQIMKAIKISMQQKFNYAILQIEFNQFKQKRKRIELFKKLKKQKRSKSLNFSRIKLFFWWIKSWLMNFQKEIFFKIMISKKYKNATQHDLNIFIRECRKIFEIRKHIYFDDKNKILFIKTFFENVSTKNWKKHQKIIDIIFIS